LKKRSDKKKVSAGSEMGKFESEKKFANHSLKGIKSSNHK